MSERESNARQIESEISDLENEFASSVLDLLDISLWFGGADSSDYDRFWASVREINGMFKELQLEPTRREELWERLSRLCEDVKRSHASQKEQRRYLLDANRDKVWQAVHNLNSSHNLKGMAGMFQAADLKGFWADAKEVSEVFRETKPLRSNDRQELWEDFQELCEYARELQEQKHEEWRARNEEHLDRWRGYIEKNEEVIQRLKGQIEDCENQKADARSDDFASEVQGWIDEKERIIDDIEGRSAELWNKIHDVESRLRS
ncbi:MAG: hypothetical protein WAO58_04360 [Fimbriimonadaceae bacterium]